MIVGIDLGTTNSLVAVWRNGQSELLPNALGERLTPSCVSVDEDGSILVGRAARERLQTHPGRSAAVFKRYMGTDRVVRLGEHSFRAEDLSALILKSLKADAEAFLGEPVTEAVITVPAYFSDSQRKATRAAGRIAGLKVERLLNEPTAAALAYGMHHRGAETRFLVFDLGGGTFDVSILEMFEGVMEVRASAGDNVLGGEDFAAVLIDLFFERNALDAALRNDAHFMQRLSAAADLAKRQLSSQPEATLQAQHGERQYQLTLSESDFERACKPLLQRLSVPVERAMRDAGLRAGMLDNVVLAGGATRMPMVRRLATTMFGRFPSIELHPDEVVALGAAVQAGLKARDAALEEVVMTDVAPYSLGVELTRRLHDGSFSGGNFDPIIERNMAVPISRAKSYVPTQERQTMVDLRIYQGEARLVRDNIHIGDLRVPLPRLEQGLAEVDVRFTYDVNGLLEVQATVMNTGDTVRLVIEGNPGLLGEDEIRERLQRLSELKIHPRDTLENRTTLARAERIYQQVRGRTREWLSLQIAEFVQTLNLQDARAIAVARKRLEEQLQAVEADAVLHTET